VASFCIRYLTGSKAYRAIGEFGYETTTLDMEGNVTKTGPVNHVTMDSIDKVLPAFTGKIMQVPPIFSALKKDGKKLYQSAREGLTTDDIKIEAREVEMLKLDLVRSDDVALPKFEIAMECGGGTYVRSLIRDIGHKLDTVATTTLLERTKQAQFTLDDCLPKPEWNADNIYAEIERRNRIREAEVSDRSPE
jgi:tRNA pseudouridine55 synthase